MEMTRRAYSLLEVKAVNEEKRVIRGVATTPSTDRVGDIVEPLGVKFKNPLALLWQHDSMQPIGTVKFDKPTKDGITFEAEIPVIDTPGTLKDRIDEAWQSIQLGLVRAVSIGFRAIEYAFIDNSYGIRFIESEVFELSVVTIPANADAVITSKCLDAEALKLIKSFDVGAPKAADDSPIQSATAPAAIGKKARVVRLDAPARDRAKPFVIRSIRRT